MSSGSEEGTNSPSYTTELQTSLGKFFCTILTALNQFVYIIVCSADVETEQQQQSPVTMVTGSAPLGTVLVMYDEDTYSMLRCILTCRFKRRR